MVFQQIHQRDRSRRRTADLQLPERSAAGRERPRQPRDGISHPLRGIGRSGGGAGLARHQPVGPADDALVRTVHDGAWRLSGNRCRHRDRTGRRPALLGEQDGVLRRLRAGGFPVGTLTPLPRPRHQRVPGRHQLSPPRELLGRRVQGAHASDSPATRSDRDLDQRPLHLLRLGARDRARSALRCGHDPGDGNHPGAGEAGVRGVHGHSRRRRPRHRGVRRVRDPSHPVHAGDLRGAARSDHCRAGRDRRHRAAIGSRRLHRRGAAPDGPHRGSGRVEVLRRRRRLRRQPVRVIARPHQRRVPHYRDPLHGRSAQCPDRAEGVPVPAHPRRLREPNLPAPGLPPGALDGVERGRSGAPGSAQRRMAGKGGDG